MEFKLKQIEQLEKSIKETSSRISKIKNELESLEKYKRSLRHSLSVIKNDSSINTMEDTEVVKTLPNEYKEMQLIDACRQYFKKEKSATTKQIEEALRAGGKQGSEKFYYTVYGTLVRLQKKYKEIEKSGDLWKIKEINSNHAAP